MSWHRFLTLVAYALTVVALAVACKAPEKTSNEPRPVRAPAGHSLTHEKS